MCNRARLLKDRRRAFRQPRVLICLCTYRRPGGILNQTTRDFYKSRAGTYCPTATTVCRFALFEILGLCGSASPVEPPGPTTPIYAERFGPRVLICLCTYRRPGGILNQTTRDFYKSRAGTYCPTATAVCGFALFEILGVCGSASPVEPPGPTKKRQSIR